MCEEYVPKLPKKRKDKHEFIKPSNSIIRNNYLSYREAMEQLKPAIAEFLSKWLNLSASLSHLNSIGARLYEEMMTTYDESEEEEDENE